MLDSGSWILYFLNAYFVNFAGCHNAMDIRDPDDFIIESGPMGPIGEAGSLILRVNRNCPWNRCLFCTAYKDRTFSRRSAQEIKGDIDRIVRIAALIEEGSFELGYSGNVSREVLLHVIRNNPSIFIDNKIDSH